MAALSEKRANLAQVFITPKKEIEFVYALPRRGDGGLTGDELASAWALRCVSRLERFNPGSARRFPIFTSNSNPRFSWRLFRAKQNSFGKSVTSSHQFRPAGARSA
jgi:hypothetical protein